MMVHYVYIYLIGKKSSFPNVISYLKRDFDFFLYSCPRKTSFEFYWIFTLYDIFTIKEFEADIA